MQKIVFNPHYLMYFDTAISGYWRALAMPYEEAMHQLEGDLYLKKAEVEFHASARFDEAIDVALKCQRIGTSSMTFAGAIFRNGRLLVSAELIYVFANPVTQTSRPVPDVLRDLLNGFEAGHQILHIRSGAWAEVGVLVHPLREAVFAEEQGIHSDLVSDADDQTSVHVVAVNFLGQPVATGRVTALEKGVGKIGRMAVNRMLRGTGLGRDILHNLIESSRARGDRQVVLNAQQSAEGFYRRAGFVTRGAPFEEAGMPHVEMWLELD